MKKALSLILALTLCIALAVPAMAAEGFGEVSFDYDYQFRPARVTFHAAKMEVTNVEGLGDGGFENGIYKNAILVTVQSGSTFSTTDSTIPGMNIPAPKVEGTGFAVGDDGKLYSVAHMSIGTLEGNVDDLFGNTEKAYYFGANSADDSHFKNGADDHDICLVWLSEFSAYDNDGNGHSLFIARDEKTEAPAPTTTTPAATDTVAGFSDVAANAYYADAVKWAAEKNITNGVGGGKFGPDSDLTRAEAVTFLWRAKGSPAPTSTNNPFTDVKEGTYYHNAVLWAVENGITNGVSADKFSVDGKVTRGEMVTFLWRTEGKPNDIGGEWYESAENWAKGNDLLTGTAEAYATGANCPRADVVYYLYRDLAQ